MCQKLKKVHLTSNAELKLRTIFGVEWAKNINLQALLHLFIGSAYAPLETRNSIDIIYAEMARLIQNAGIIDEENKLRKWHTYMDFYYKSTGAYRWQNWNYFHLVSSKPGAISTTNGSEGSVLL